MTNPTRRSLLWAAAGSLGIAATGIGTGTAIASGTRKTVGNADRNRTTEVGDLSWPEYGYDPQNRGWARTDLEPAATAVERWDHEFEPFQYGRSPVLTDGELAFVHGRSTLEAFDPSTETVRWSVDEYLNVAPITIRSGRLYAFSNDILVTFDTESGDATERGTLPFRPAGATIDDGIAYLTGVDRDEPRGTVAAVSTEDATEHWHHTIEDQVLFRPAVTSDGVFVGCERPNGERSGGVVALDREDGTERWRELSIERVQSPIAASDGLVFATSADGPAPLTAFDAETGEIQWRDESLNGTKISPTIGPDCVYYGTTDEMLAAIDLDSGEPVWRIDVDGRIEHATPALVGDTLYVGTSFGGEDRETARLYAIDRRDGSKLWQTSFEGRIISPPAALADCVVVLNSDFGTTELPDRLVAFSAGPIDETDTDEEIGAERESVDEDDGVPGFGLGAGAIGLGTGLYLADRDSSGLDTDVDETR